MDLISENRLEELGFKHISDFEFRKGEVLLVVLSDAIDVYVCSSVVPDSEYGQNATGVKTEADLMMLCKLVDG